MLHPIRQAAACVVALALSAPCAVAKHGPATLAVDGKPTTFALPRK